MVGAVDEADLLVGMCLEEGGRLVPRAEDHAVGRDQTIPRPQAERRRRGARLDLPSVRVVSRIDAGRKHEDEQDHDGREKVHQRAGEDRQVALPDRLVVVGPRDHVGGQLLVGAHAADLAEAAEGDDPDAVLGLAALPFDDRRRKADVEALDPHAEELGDDEVTELVHEDEQRQSEDRPPATSSGQ